MNYGALIGITASLAGLLAYVVKISMSYSRLQTHVKELKETISSISTDNTQLKQHVNTLEIIMENNNKRDEEERIKTSKKFDELYASKNKTNEVLTELNTTIKMMISNFDKQFTNLDKKIDDLKRG